jgi:REP element-mobilizing transposase RayT
MDHDRHRRRSLRLPHYDYSQEGAYYITICTDQRECKFGDIVDEQMELNKLGQIVKNEWKRSGKLRDEIDLDIYQVMPNHFHAILFIRPVTKERSHVGASGARPFRIKPKSLASLIAGFKSSTTSIIRKMSKDPNLKVWQRGYYEHVIRNEAELNAKREYILNNPLKWELDRNNPANW